MPRGFVSQRRLNGSLRLRVGAIVRRIDLFAAEKADLGETGQPKLMWLTKWHPKRDSGPH